MDAGNGTRILVVDDDPSVSHLCRRVLDREGFGVEIAESGRQGLQMLAGERFDLVLLDVNMPDLSGLDVLATMRQTDLETPVVVFTGYGTMETAIAALRSGAQDFLLKPFETRHLIASIRKALERDRLLQENLRLKTLLPILEISQELVSEMDRERLAHRALQIVRRELGASQADLTFEDKECQGLSAWTVLEPSQEMAASVRTEAERALCQAAIREKRPLLASDGDGGKTSWCTSGHCVCAPLVLRDRVVGVLKARRPLDGAPFRQDDLGLLSILCEQVAVALENVRLFEQTKQEIAERTRAEEALRRHAERLEILHEIEQGILSAQSPTDIARVAASRIRKLVPCQWVGISLFDLMSKEAIILAVDSDHETKNQQGSRVPLGDVIYAWSNLDTLHQGKSVSCDGLGPEDRAPGAQVPEGRHALHIVPLIVRNKLIGAASLRMDGSAGYSQEWESTVRQIADQLAIAIQQARLSRAEAQRRLEAEALRDTATVLNSTLDLEEVLDRILDNIGRVVPHDAASIMLVENDMAYVVRHRGYIGEKADAKTLGGGIAVAELPALSEMAASVLPLAIPDTRDYPGWVNLYGTPGEGSYAGAPICSQGRLVGFLNLNSTTPGVFHPVQAKRLQAFADQAAVAIENARLHNRLQGYIEQLEQRVIDRTKELTALYEVTTITSESLDLETTLERSLQQALSAIGGNAGAIELLDEAEGTLRLAAQQNMPDSALTSIGHVPPHTPSLGALVAWVLEHNEPLVVSDMATDARMPQTSGRPHFRAYAGVPMRIGRQVIGVLEAFSEMAHRFNAEDIALLASLADHVATAVESSRLREQAERTVVMEERERLARELHDSVTQSLYSLTLLAEAGCESIRTGALQDAQQHTRRVSEIAQDALKEMRLLVHELRPPVLEKEGLVGALRQRLEAVEGRAGVKTRLLADDLADLPASVEEDLYRIALEALNNALKHATASSVNVYVRTQGGAIELEVADNGTGFDPDGMSDAGGVGLSSMRERAEKLGATLTIQSAPGKGTQVLARIAEVQTDG